MTFSAFLVSFFQAFMFIVKSFREVAFFDSFHQNFAQQLQK